MWLLVKQLWEGVQWPPVAHAHQACWGYLGYGYVFAVWVICLLMQKQLADNLLAQVRKFSDQVAQLAKNALCS